MKLTEFKKLENKVKRYDFHSSYKNINKVMFSLSIFGHLVSIFLAFFLLNKALLSAIGNPVVSAICSIILLGGLELLKREIFDKYSIQILKVKNFFNKDVFPLFILSLMLVSLSYYATISGAKEFSSKEKEIIESANKSIASQTDTINNRYNIEIKSIKSEIAENKQKIDKKDNEQTQIESSDKITQQQKNRIRDLKTEKSDLKKDNDELEQRIKELENKASLEVEKLKSDTNVNIDTKKKENNSNTLFFAFISSLIEIVIISGVFFNEYYKFKSYNDFKVKISNDPNYQNWILYNAVIESVYNDDTQINDKMPSAKNIIIMCKINGTNILPKDMALILRLFNTLGITRTSGSARYISKDKANAQEIIKKHFSIE